ncbi:MAG: kinase [Rhodospirillaceae bacterium]
MIITRTPFRISLFGGGTDYPAWYRENGGAVLAGSINKYCYLSCRRFPPFFEVKYRVVYNRIELVNTVDEIEHPSVRTCIKSYGPDDTGLEIVHNADLPARSGLGSSSAFTVGLLHALHGLAGRLVGRPQLAEQAIHLEQEVMCENVGSQDQIAVALGGLNVISFAGDGWRAQPLPLPRLRREELEAHLMLFFTGISRTASDVAAHQIRNLSRRAVELRAMQAMVDHGIEILTGNGDITDFGQLLDESWQLKRRLSEYISTDPCLSG